MTPYAAILTLTASAAASAPPSLGIDGLEAIEHVPLPAATARPPSLRVQALDALVVLGIPSRTSPDLVRALRKAPRAICPDLEERPFEVHLKCRSRRIVARLVPHETGPLLEIGETRGLPWGGVDGPPLLSFDPPEIGLGDPCPGSTPAGRAECLLGRGDRAGARAAFEQIADGPGLDLAQLRLGDLALDAGDLRAAVRAWERVRNEPWQRLAAARLCEASWTCLSAARSDALYATQGLPDPLSRDLTLRQVRALGFLDRFTEASRKLLGANSGQGPCVTAPALCRRTCLLALRAPGPDAIEGLLLWLELPDRGRGDASYELELAAAAAAERSGAPLFGANVLAAAVGHVPPRALPEHLLRTCELYLAGGDRVRAGVVLEFARSRLGRKGLAGPRWAAIARDTAGAAHAAAHAVERAPSQVEHESELLAAAVRSAENARALAQGGRP